MSSKQQFREALKGDKKIIADLKKEITLRDEAIRKLQNNVNFQKVVNEQLMGIHNKKWWQFWK